MVEDLAALFRARPHMLLADYRGLTANQANDLRRRVRGIGGGMMVLKNRLAKRAAAGTALEGIRDQLEGTCALAVHETDPVALAKALGDFAKDNPQLQLRAAVVDAKDVLDAEGVKALAALPGLPELRAQLLALFQTPGTQLVRLLGTPASQLARAVDARREKLEGTE
jgi:large subunit ribosomal protein L10